jgi:hypothetical protein
MLNTRPISWIQKKLSKWVNKYDIEKALEWEYARGKKDGLQEGHATCPICHNPWRMASPGVQVCDQCQMDTRIERYYSESPNTGPIVPVVSQTGAWRKHFFAQRPDLRRDISQELRAIKTSDIDYLLKELKKRLTS